MWTTFRRSYDSKSPTAFKTLVTHSNTIYFVNLKNKNRNKFQYHWNHKELCNPFFSYYTSNRGLYENHKYKQKMKQTKTQLTPPRDNYY